MTTPQTAPMQPIAILPTAIDPQGGCGSLSFSADKAAGLHALRESCQVPRVVVLRAPERRVMSDVVMRSVDPPGYGRHPTPAPLRSCSSSRVHTHFAPMFHAHCSLSDSLLIISLQPPRSAFHRWPWTRRRMRHMGCPRPYHSSGLGCMSLTSGGSSTFSGHTSWPSRSRRRRPTKFNIVGAHEDVAGCTAGRPVAVRRVIIARGTCRRR